MPEQITPDDLTEMQSILDALAEDFELSVGTYLRGRALFQAARLDLSSADAAEVARLVNSYVDSVREVLAELVAELRASLPTVDDYRADLHDRIHDENYEARRDNARLEGDDRDNDEGK